jgi:hypothetical protein
MPLTTEQLRKVNLFRASVRLQDPAVETDPVYAFEDDELWDIMTLTAPTHNVLYTIDSVPDNELYFAIQLAKKEVYYRLATSTAPFYPLEAEGASLQKNVRFDHYMALIKQTSEDYAAAWEKFQQGDGIVRTYEVQALSHYYTLRNYNVANKPTVELTVSGITEEQILLDWTKYAVPGGLFQCYKVFIDTESQVDEYAEFPVNPNKSAVFHTVDIHRLKWRIRGLTPDTEYYVLVVSYDRNGLYGYSEQLIRTLAP